MSKRPLVLSVKPTRVTAARSTTGCCTSRLSDIIIVVTGLMTANNGARQFYLPQRTFLY